MAGGPQSEPRCVAPNEMRALGIALLENAGAPTVHARIVMDHLIESSEMGLHSHGVMRIPQYLAEIQSYWFNGPRRRFARDAGVSEATFSRIMRGATNPRYADICRIVAHLEKKLGRKIDPRDIYEP